MIVNKWLWLVLLIGLIGCKKSKKALIRNNLPVLEKSKDCDLDLYICQRVSKRADFFLTNNKLKKAQLIIGSFIHDTGETNADLQKLGKAIDQLIPQKNAKGIVVLNWEGKGLKILTESSPESKEFKRALSEFIKALKFAKQKRPNIQWGYYSIPLINYWSRNAKWEKQNEALISILEHSDIIFPSVYDYYENSTPFAGPTMDSLYVNDNIVQALKFGSKLKKPVMAFIWHRYHPSNEKKRYELIPWDEFEPHIQSAINARFNNHQIDALIWWGADKYFYKQKKKALVRESANAGNFDDYHNRIIIDYTEKIYKLIDECCKKEREKDHENRPSKL